MRVLSPLGTSMQSVSWQSVSVAEHDSHFDDFSYKTSGQFCGKFILVIVHVLKFFKKKLEKYLEMS